MVMVDEEIEQKICAKTYKECRAKLYDLYGDGYDVRDKRAKLHPGFLGIGKREEVEVTYVVKRKNKSQQGAYDQSDDFLSRSVRAQYSMEDTRDAILNQNNGVLLSAQTKKIDEMNSKLEDLARSFEKNMNAVKSGENKPESIAKIEELLQQNDFSFSFIQMITDKIKQFFPLSQIDDFDLVERAVVDWIGETIVPAQKRAFRPPHVVVIVGPTGVGKTTTLVKLVAKEIVDARNDSRSFNSRLITTDVTRVGALEQLSRFGEIMHREVLKAESADDLRILFEENKDHCDAIYIDTSGYSPNDSESIGKMKSMLDVPGLTSEVFLAFDAKTKTSDIKNIMKNYEPFGYSSVIVTKCDESLQYGNVISALYEQRKSIAYITDGQNAAKNIQAADVLYFLNRLEGFRIDRKHIEEKFSKYLGVK